MPSEITENSKHGYETSSRNTAVRKISTLRIKFQNSVRSINFPQGAGRQLWPTSDVLSSEHRS